MGEKDSECRSWIDKTGVIGRFNLGVFARICSGLLYKFRGGCSADNQNKTPRRSERLYG